VEIYPTPDASAKSACEALLKHFGRYGAPLFIRSDNGSHFANKVIQEFLQAVGTRHNLTLAYCSQENATVERCNKEINRHIRAFVFEREGYQSIIPFVQRILNASVNDTMRTSPAQLLFGNALKLDRGILLPPEELLLPLQSVTRSTSRMLHDQEVLLGTASKL
jgi:transposase InsO family protein